MFVEERMSKPVIVAYPEMLVQDALLLMRREHIRRLPVVDQQGTLVGIVSDRDLLEASPSRITSLSVWELNSLIGKLTLGKIMTRPVITVEEETTLEEAARLMADHKIGGLPVVRDGKVVGIITETDLFKIFLELLGAREPGVRISAAVPNTAEALAQISSSIAAAGGRIVALSTFRCRDSQTCQVIVKVAGISRDQALNALPPLVQEILDARETSWDLADAWAPTG